MFPLLDIRSIIHPRFSIFIRCPPFRRLDHPPESGDDNCVRFGGAPVSTWETRQRRHAEDDALASLIFASNKTANDELALAA